MPANAAAIERHYTQPPDDERGETCDDCQGSGYRVQWDSPRLLVCETCHGTGYLDPQDAAEALGERMADDAYEASIDREMGL